MVGVRMAVQCRSKQRGPSSKRRSPLLISPPLLHRTSWEMVWHGLCEWFGADVAQISSEILPNLDNFPVEGRLRLFS